MKKTLKYIAFVTMLVFSVSSCDYLDKREETDGLSLEEVFGNANNYELYVEWMIQNPILQYLQNGLHPHGSWDDISDNSMSTANFVVPCLVVAQGDFWTMISHGNCVMSNEKPITRRNR